MLRKRMRTFLTEKTGSFPDFFLDCVFPSAESTKFSSSAMRGCAHIADMAFFRTKFRRWRRGVATWSVTLGTGGFRSKLYDSPAKLTVMAAHSFLSLILIAASD